MTTDRDDIASCPFCGGEAKLRRLVEKYPAEGEHPAGEYDAWFYVNCDDCGIEVGDEYESSAIDAWNRRAPSASMGRVTIRKLEWDGDEAKTPFGCYSVHKTEDGYQAVFGHFEELAHVGFNAVDAHYGARRAAQDHAQADYETRILAALDSPPDHGGGEGWQP